MNAGQTLAKHWANVVKEKKEERREGVGRAEEHLSASGIHVVGGGKGSEKRLLQWMTGDVHWIVLGEDGTSTCDDLLVVCVKKGVMVEGVLAYGGGEGLDRRTEDWEMD